MILTRRIQHVRKFCNYVPDIVPVSGTLVQYCRILLKKKKNKKKKELLPYYVLRYGNRVPVLEQYDNLKRIVHGTTRSFHKKVSITLKTSTLTKAIMSGKFFRGPR